MPVFLAAAGIAGVPNRYFGNKERHIMESIPQFHCNDDIGCSGAGQGFLYSTI